MEKRSIQKYAPSIKNKFNKEYFFKDILKYCYENGFLNDIDLNKISYERLEILKVQLKYYTNDESSSVMVELADDILKGIDYTIGVYLKEIDNMELMVNKFKSGSLFTMLEEGNIIIKEKFIKSKVMLDNIQKNKLNINNYSYNDTLDEGLSIFFEGYEPRFRPHIAPCSIDYQLCNDDMKLVGIEYMENYLKILSLETEFCNNFTSDKISELLRSYYKNAELLLINVFELLLINSIGLTICSKPVYGLDISEMDRNYIKNKLDNLNIASLKHELLEYGDKCCESLNIKNNELIEYIKEAIIKIAVNIDSDLKLNKLEKIFISFYANDNELIRYIDKEKMSNSRFRKLTDKIRKCYLIEDKIRLIKENIKSLEDLIDMLSSNCLFEDEFTEYFKSLSQMEIILLYKYVDDLYLDSGFEKEWCREFNEYILSLTDEEQKIISDTVEKIIIE